VRFIRLAAPLSVLAAACGLLASPGDYTSPDEPDSSTQTGGDAQQPLSDSPPPSDNYVPPGSAGILLVVAGQRDPLSAADDPAWTNDVWSGVLDADGHVIRWDALPAAPLPGPFDAIGTGNGQLLTLSYALGIGGGRGDALSAVAWSPGPNGGWKANGVGMPGGLDERARAIFGSHVVTVGGVRYIPIDGGTQTVITKEVHVADIDTTKNELGTFNDPGVTLVNARSRVGVAIVDDHIVVAGGRAPTPTGFTGTVETAKVDETAGTVGAFTAQPNLTSGGTDHRVWSPGVAGGGGFVFVAGGRLTFAGNPTDVVVSASIGSDGTITNVKNGPSLPMPLRDLGLVVHRSKLYVIGGQTAANRVDTVYSATIAADGSVGAWETNNQKLPGARSDLVVVAYGGGP
jgi:hypothetical protein